MRKQSKLDLVQGADHFTRFWQSLKITTALAYKYLHQQKFV